MKFHTLNLHQLQMHQKLTYVNYQHYTNNQTKQPYLNVLTTQYAHPTLLNLLHQQNAYLNLTLKQIQIPSSNKHHINFQLNL